MKKLRPHIRKFWKAKRKPMIKKMLSYENNGWQKRLKSQKINFIFNQRE